MDGERRFVTVMIGVGMVCLTMLYAFLFVSLWAYRQWVGASLLAVLVSLPKPGGQNGAAPAQPWQVGAPARKGGAQNGASPLPGVTSVP